MTVNAGCASRTPSASDSLGGAGGGAADEFERISEVAAAVVEQRSASRQDDSAQFGRQRTSEERDSGSELMDARGLERRTIAAEAQLRRSGNLNYMVRAYDLSQQGCKLEFVEKPRISEPVWVKFDGLAAIEARVRWTEDHILGVEFASPIDSRVLGLLLARLESGGAVQPKT